MMKTASTTERIIKPVGTSADYAETYISTTPVGINTWVYLSDFQVNPIYGGCHKSTNIGHFYCNLEDRECRSEAEWNELGTFRPLSWPGSWRAVNVCREKHYPKATRPSR